MEPISDRNKQDDGDNERIKLCLFHIPVEDSVSLATAKFVRIHPRVRFEATVEERESIC